MKVLSIGTDRKLFEEKSAVLARSLEYASKMEESHIIVFSRRSQRLTATKINNLYIYPTNSLSRWTYVFGAHRLAKKIIVRNRFVRGKSVVSAQDPFECGFAAWRVARLFRLPLQLQIHTDFLSPYFNNSFLNRIRGALAKFLIPKAAGLRVVSQVIADSLETYSPDLKMRISILPVFVDVKALMDAPIVENMRKDFLEFSFIIFMASRLTREKCIETALHALKKVLTTFSDIGFVIAGDGPERKSLEGTVNSLGLSAHVKFIGWRENLVSYYKTATIFLSTSEYEGYGMSLIEAGACGCPIVTTDVGVAKTDLFKSGQNCLICKVGDVDGVYDALADLIENHEKRELFKDRMQATIASAAMSKEEYVSKYVALLEVLLPVTPKK